MRSELNEGVPRRPGPASSRPLAIGPLAVEPPVVLAPMAGVTNPPFRTPVPPLRRGPLRERDDHRARARRGQRARRCCSPSFAPDEKPRSLQLYGVDPRYVGEAVRLARRRGARRPHRPELRLPGAEGHAPRRRRRDPAASRGCCARSCARPSRTRARVPGHDQVPHRHRRRPARRSSTPAASARTRAAPRSRCTRAPRRSSTTATRAGTRSRALKNAVRTIPVLGNGDIWEAWDALRMMRETGCDGVVVGRGCLGRPWLFRDLADVFAGREPAAPPRARRRSSTSCSSTPSCSRPGSGEGRGAARVPQARAPGTRRASAAARGCASGCSRVATAGGAARRARRPRRRGAVPAARDARAARQARRHASASRCPRAISTTWTTRRRRGPRPKTPLQAANRAPTPRARSRTAFSAVLAPSCA